MLDDDRIIGDLSFSDIWSFFANDTMLNERQKLANSSLGAPSSPNCVTLSLDDESNQRAQSSSEDSGDEQRSSLLEKIR